MSANCAATCTTRRRATAIAPIASAWRSATDCGRTSSPRSRRASPFRDVLEFYAATEGNVALFNFDSHPGAVGRLPGWAAKRFPIRTVAYDVDANVEKRDAAGHCLECGVDEPGELLGEILDDPGKPAAKFDGYCDPAATQGEDPARRVQARRRVVSHRRPAEARRARLLLFRRPHRRHLSLEGRERVDDRGRRDDLRLPRRARGDRLRRRRARPRRPRRHGGAGGRQRRRIRPRRPARRRSPSACRPTRGRCSCASGRSSTSPAPSSRARSSWSRKGSTRSAAAIRSISTIATPDVYARVDADFVAAAKAGAIPL